eukprot:CAMPEP_0177639608 /NCGR_PEP_ID=MMETSP0447-20121125/6111_1 /TAXON_ID=0 /ORGANISM="Stygamoeba regulata, Strain BSH-02190019" /LENGTH=1093 /DNA_ID=CAMNT_0019141645 /DNA_START=419 /DNA_END=3697 /DNA_ORIENTATION=-
MRRLITLLLMSRRFLRAVFHELCRRHDNSDDVVHALLQEAHAEGKLESVLDEAVYLEMSRTESPQQLLRKESPTKLCIVQAAKQLSEGFCSDVVASMVNMLDGLDPTYLSSSPEQQEKFLSIVSEFLVRLPTLTMQLPPPFFRLCGMLAEAARTRFPNEHMIDKTSMCAFFFLHFLCPTLACPGKWGLVSAVTQQKSLLLARFIQLMTNRTIDEGVDVDSSNFPWAADFIRTNRSKLLTFLDTLTTGELLMFGAWRPAPPPSASQLQSKSHIFSFLHTHKIAIMAHLENSTAQDPRTDASEEKMLAGEALSLSDLSNNDLVHCFIVLMNELEPLSESKIPTSKWWELEETRLSDWTVEDFLTLLDILNIPGPSISSKKKSARVGNRLLNPSFLERKFNIRNPVHVRQIAKALDDMCLSNAPYLEKDGKSYRTFTSKPNALARSTALLAEDEDAAEATASPLRSPSVPTRPPAAATARLGSSLTPIAQSPDFSSNENLDMHIRQQDGFRQLPVGPLVSRESTSASASSVTFSAPDSDGEGLGTPNPPLKLRATTPILSDPNMRLARRAKKGGSAIGRKDDDRIAKPVLTRSLSEHFSERNALVGSSDDQRPNWRRCPPTYTPTLISFGRLHTFVLEDPLPGLASMVGLVIGSRIWTKSHEPACPASRSNSRPISCSNSCTTISRSSSHGGSTPASPRSGQEPSLLASLHQNRSSDPCTMDALRIDPSRLGSLLRLSDVRTVSPVSPLHLATMDRRPSMSRSTHITPTSRGDRVRAQTLASNDMKGAIPCSFSDDALFSVIQDSQQRKLSMSVSQTLEVWKHEPPKKVTSVEDQIHFHRKVVESDTARVTKDLQAGIDPNVANEHGETAMHLCCINTISTSMITLLLNFKADANKPTLNGDAPLHYACSNDKKRAAKMLLKWPHIRPNLLNNSGQHAADLVPATSSSLRKKMEEAMFSPILKWLAKEPWNSDDCTKVHAPDAVTDNIPLSIFTVGVQSVDQSHKLVLNTFSILASINSPTTALECVDNVLQFLSSHASSALKAEEALLKSHRYPDLSAHVREHRKFAANTASLLKSHQSGSHVSPVRVATFIRDW